RRSTIFVGPLVSEISPRCQGRPSFVVRLPDKCPEGPFAFRYRGPCRRGRERGRDTARSQATVLSTRICASLTDRHGDGAPTASRIRHIPIPQSCAAYHRCCTPHRPPPGKCPW